MMRRAFQILLGLSLPLLGTGCLNQTRQANIELRRQTVVLENRIEQLQREAEQSRQVIARLQQQLEPGAFVLPDELRRQLHTTAGLRVGRLTRQRDDAIELHFVPTDAQGHDLKAAGSLEVELLDLRATPARSLSRWSFTPRELRESFVSGGLIYQYILHCPLPDALESGSYTLNLVFTDLLTASRVSARHDIIIAR